MTCRQIVRSLLPLPFAAVFSCMFFGSAVLAEDAETGFVALFNGKDLKGWEGKTDAWAVREGAITCLGTSAKKNWLIWRGGQPGDFELRLRFKFVHGNSGVQVRSEEITRWQVQGYQAEIAQREKMGKWHHSIAPVKRRHYLATAGQKVRIAADGEKVVSQFAEAAEVQAAYRENAWNDLVIVARGPRLVQSNNGVVIAELIDEDDQYARRTGIIAFQDHGQGTVARFKDIRLRRFEDQSAATHIRVTSVEELRSATRSLAPGTVVEIGPGTYELSNSLAVTAYGSDEQPVVIRATTPGKSRFRGKDGIEIHHSSHVVVDGLAFEGIRGVRCRHSEHVRFTNCRFQLEQTGQKNNWLAFDESHHGRVDHCEFGARADAGSYIHLSRGDRFFRIDHNYFHDYRELGYNGGESIYLHGTGVWAIHAVVENNLFERCNGEGELIGIKSHRNVIRGNTFKDCRGAVSIRDGDYNSVYDNVFLAPNESRAAGVRIHGQHNAFVNNYLYGVYKPVECCWGETEAPHRENMLGHGNLTKLAFAYRASHDNLVAHNSFVRCDTIFQWTKKRIPMAHIRDKMGDVERNGPFLAALWKKKMSQYLVGGFVEPRFPATRWYVLNNVIVNTPQLVRVALARGTPPPAREEDFRWQGNLAYCESGEFDLGAGRVIEEDQLQLHYPELIEAAPGVYRPGPASICRGSAEVKMKTVKDYVDRPDISAVLGAMEDLGAQGLQVLTVADVGPSHSRTSTAATR